ncbi:hypothetical protein CDV55_103501 [Aspergillus turcosus]|nr:hypothetical protein CDV55_103501 [Aspergillus turcosus]
MVLPAAAKNATNAVKSAISHAIVPRVATMEAASVTEDTAVASKLATRVVALATWPATALMVRSATTVEMLDMYPATAPLKPRVKEFATSASNLDTFRPLALTS